MKVKSAQFPAVILARGVNGLGVIRGLSMYSVPVSIITDVADDPILYSKYLVSKFVIESKQDKGAAILEILEKHFSHTKHFLLATSDEFIEFMNRNRETLIKNFFFLLPPNDLVITLLNKSLETKLIEAAGIPLPITLSPLPANPKELLDSVDLPIIIKPLLYNHMEIIGKKNLIITSKETLIELYNQLKDNVQYFLAQEIIPGGDESLWVCNCAFDRESNLVQAFTFKRYRTCPAHFGVTSYAVSKKNDTIISMVGKIGEKFRYVGPAMFEFKFDHRDKQYKYIETNPRLGMCNFFDTLCGVNNVLASYLIATGNQDKIKPVSQADEIVYLDLFDDFFSRIKDKESVLSILAHYISNITKKHVHAHWWWRDPVPALKVVKNTLLRIKRFIYK